MDQKLVSFFSFFSPARLERNELWNCDFPFFVLFNIKPYLLYWKLQRLLSLMISEFHKAHIKVSLQNTFACLCLFLTVCVGGGSTPGVPNYFSPGAWPSGSCSAWLKLGCTFHMKSLDSLTHYSVQIQTGRKKNNPQKTAPVFSSHGLDLKCPYRFDGTLAYFQPDGLPCINSHEILKLL